MTARPAAPPPPDLSEQPRTAAGQSLLRQWSGHVNEPEVRIVVLAIEAEAMAAPAADAWQAGYEACWNRLKNAGRLLPSDGATAAVPLDVERPRWIVVSFDGKRDTVYGHRGRREKGPAKALGTIAIPLDSIRDQIEAAGYRRYPSTNAEGEPSV